MKIWTIIFISAITAAQTLTAVGQFAAVINVPPELSPPSIDSDTQLNLWEGGVIGNSFNAGHSDGSSRNVELNISGGSVGRDFRTYGGTLVKLSGGSIGDSFQAHIGSEVALLGGEFYLDEQRIGGLDYIGNQLEFDFPDGSVLSGTLADGTPFAFSWFDRDRFAGKLTLEVASLPQIDSDPIVVTGVAASQGLREGQVLLVEEGGVIGNNFNAGRESTTFVSGGQVGYNFEVVAGEVSISGGSVGGGFDALGRSTVSISGGSVGSGLSADDRSEVNISGGSIHGGFYANRGSKLNIVGGSVVGGIHAWAGSEVNVSGGAIGRFFISDDGSRLNITGGEYRLDGIPLDQLGTVGNSLALNLSDRSVLSGTLTDGTPFLLSNIDYDAIPDGTLTLHAAAPPPIASQSIVLPDDSAPRGIRSGETLIVGEGGIVPKSFHAGWGAEVFVNGGDVGEDFEAVGADVNIAAGVVHGTFRAYDGTALNISGGSIDRLSALSGSAVHVSGGLLHAGLRAENGSRVHISGGTVGNGGRSSVRTSGSELNISGGVVSTVIAGDSSSVNISGGMIGGLAFNGGRGNISGGMFGRLWTIDAEGSEATIIGGEYRLDGVLLEGLGSVGDTLAVNLPAGSVLSGTLAEGETFALSTIDNDKIYDGTLTLRVAAIPALSPSMIRLPADPTPRGIRNGQTLIVEREGAVRENFNAGWRSTVHVVGGELGSNFEAVGAEVNLVAGSIGDDFGAFFDSVVNVSGGSVGAGFRAAAGSEVNFSNGSVGDYFNVYGDSVVNISGGSIGTHFRALAGSQINISGGSFGGYFRALPHSEVNISGAEYRLNGVPLQELATAGEKLELNLWKNSLLSGTFADGTPFVFSSHDSDQFADATLTLTKEVLPPIDSGVISLPSDPAPLGVRGGETLVVNQGGIVGNHFHAGWGSEVVMAGGVIGFGFEAVGADITISAGSIDYGFDAYTGSEVKILDGQVGAGFGANSGSKINISGGAVGRYFQAFQDSEVTISGGTFGDRFTANSGSHLLISGGSFGDLFTADSGSQLIISGGSFGTLQARSGAEVDFIGKEFLLSGQPIAELRKPGDTLVLSARGGQILTGRLADDSPFSFMLYGNETYVYGEEFFSDSAVFRLTVVPEPNTALLLVVGAGLACCRYFVRAPQRLDRRDETEFANFQLTKR